MMDWERGRFTFSETFLNSAAFQQDMEVQIREKGHLHSQLHGDQFEFE
jgi:hypothetical protein